ncbi:hypothetical protein COLO4_24659 [Corchorus olitorius]|uniref:Uncharacterized protein n=1 Tax=Corchorus olitorius TaxID=93759 RepID=A0A1R3I892_9ROSI|nr:hypothetical protein COLO4_24659 [Corchorus olitorius]
MAMLRLRQKVWQREQRERAQPPPELGPPPFEPFSTVVAQPLPDFIR